MIKSCYLNVSIDTTEKNEVIITIDDLITGYREKYKDSAYNFADFIQNGLFWRSVLDDDNISIWNAIATGRRVILDEREEKEINKNS